jgi:hypothetical protein
MPDYVSGHFSDLEKGQAVLVSMIKWVLAGVDIKA